MAWLVFGGDRRPDLSRVSQCYWLAYDSPFLHSLGKLEAWQESLPLPRLVKAAIHIPNKGYQVTKQAWITEGYGLASQRTDGTPSSSYLFKESRGTLLRWVSDKPASTFFVFQENRRRPHERINNAFAYGENPYAQYFQHEGTLLGVYDVPESYGFWKLTAPFTTAGSIIARSESHGWVFAHGGTVLFAFRSAAPATWGKPDAREKYAPYTSDERRNAWVIETSAVKPFAGGSPEDELARFAEAMLKRTRFEPDLASAAPKIVFTNLSGHKLELEWSMSSNTARSICKIDGNLASPDDYPMLGINDLRIFR
jgi:hypothetical protein